MVHFACSSECFPLTLTLSLREREPQASDGFLADGDWADSGTDVIERRWTILPLPKGEGRGEGELTARACAPPHGKQVPCPADQVRSGIVCPFGTAN